MQRRGSIFQSTSDTETIIHLIATSERGPLVERLIDALNQVEGAFSLVALSEKKMIGCRDPLGVRPLLLGDLDGSPVLASETCALDIIGAKARARVEAARCWSSPRRIESQNPSATASRFCIFEHVYFARPDSIVAAPASTRSGSGSAPSWRGRRPGRRHRRAVRIPASPGDRLRRGRGIPFDFGIIRNHYVGRPS